MTTTVAVRVPTERAVRKRAAERAAFLDAVRADDEAFAAWVAKRYGIIIKQTSDLWAHADALGMSPYEVRKTYRTERGDS
jgi:hypothetical protein